MLVNLWQEITFNEDSMGVTRTDLFTDHQNQLATIAKALAHPARIAILEYLLRCGTCFNGDLVKELGLAQPTISQHLKELKNLGIIKGTIEGVSVNYCINAEQWEEIKNILSQFLNSFQTPENPQCC